MTQSLIRHSAALTLLSLLQLAPVQATVLPHIELLEVWRNSTVSAQLAVIQNQGQDGQLPQGASRHYRDGGELWGLDHDEIRYPLAISLPANPDYSGFADGQVRQQQQLDLATISVQQLADVNVSAQGDTFSQTIEGQGQALAEARYRFILHGDALTRLDMDSSVNQFRDDNVRFLLERLVDGGGSEVVWQDTVVYDDQWQPQRTFSRKLELTAGTYQLQLSASAHSTLSGNDQRAENSQIQATLVVISALCQCCRLPEGKGGELVKGDCEWLPVPPQPQPLRH